jgi:hypothetical protein
MRATAWCAVCAGVVGASVVAGQEAAVHDGIGMSPPDGAVVLFSGTETEQWVSAKDGSPYPWDVVDGAMVVRPGVGSVCTRDVFQDFTLHLEFMVPESPAGAMGQGRGNSGVYIQRRYEVQILDSFGLEAGPRDCGAIYGRTPPRVNASRAPGQWQSYLIEFTSPRFGPLVKEDGKELRKKVRNARLTVRHNGVLIHDDVEVEGKTGYGDPEGPTAGPILFQDHGHAVKFRNVWLKPRAPTWEGPGAEGFVPLFDGRTLDGWHQLGGKAAYRAEDGQIVGATRPNQPNSFLCTDREYGDFVLELEFKVDPELNSGVQIRSESTPEYQKGRVHGYQVEIDPSDRAWSAGIYDEGRRGWLAPLKDNEPARKAFRQGQWNRVRIVAKGDSLRTYLNGVPAADLIDAMTPRGFIGLQVHGVGGRTDPIEVRWRDLRIRELK